MQLRESGTNTFQSTGTNTGTGGDNFQSELLLVSILSNQKKCNNNVPQPQGFDLNLDNHSVLSVKGSNRAPIGLQ